MKLADIIDNFDSLKETDEGLTQFNLAKHYIIDKLEENKLIHDFIFFASLILKNRIKLEKNLKESDLRKRSISLRPLHTLCKRVIYYNHDISC